MRRRKRPAEWRQGGGWWCRRNARVIAREERWWGEESVEEFDILILGDKRAEGDDLRAGDFSLCARVSRLVGLKSTRVE